MQYCIQTTKLNYEIMRPTIEQLEVKRFANFGKYYVTHSRTNVSVVISKKEYERMTDRGLVRKYFPNWKESF